MFSLRISAWKPDDKGLRWRSNLIPEAFKDMSNIDLFLQPGHRMFTNFRHRIAGNVAFLLSSIAFSLGACLHAFSSRSVEHFYKALVG